MKMEDHFALPLIMPPPNPSATAKIAAAHAINCHDELVEALEDCVCVLSGGLMTKQSLVTALTSARAILTKAKGE